MCASIATVHADQAMLSIGPLGHRLPLKPGEGRGVTQLSRAAGSVAIPCGAAGWRYAFDSMPLAPPPVVIRDQSAVTQPGSAVHRR